MDSWPFKKYLEKLKMWYRTSEYKVGDGIIGPLVALRLKGEACEIAVKLRVTTQGGQVLAGMTLWLTQESQSKSTQARVLSSILAHVMGLNSSWNA